MIRRSSVHVSTILRRRKMRKILIAAVLVLILPVLASSAWAVNWVEIGGNI